ncbi:hypothetical protein C2G38_2198102 [Gigaspora rosea]|uniref:SHSP domain-containing protein n=1 Tax=Gigaspora rosea TaxID=44941 RepID=A0A397UW11_9GLOM|nr:hypothetical protein C2G38_2198102 [Gigaspora rosea]
MSLSLYWPDEYRFGQFENSISCLFDDFFKDLNIERQSVMRMRRAPLDVHEDEKEFVVSAELPIKFKLDIRDNTLVISGETKKDEKYKAGNAHSVVMEVSLMLSLFLVENGVLEIKLPKDESKETRMKIDH